MNTAPTPRHAATAIVGIAAVLALAACNHQNHRNDFGGQVALPALSAEAMADEPPTSDGSSLSSLDRRHWKPLTIEVPIHGIAHGPTYATRHRSTDSTARQRGEPLTALNALELSGDSFTDDALDTAGAPLYCIWDALLLVPRAMVTRPWTEIRGDNEPYWRASVWDARRQPAPRSSPPAAVSEPAAEPVT